MVIIDCDTCEVRGPACSDCVVPVLLGHPGWGAGADDGSGAGAGGRPAGALHLDAGQARALRVLAGSGLVPPLRLVSRTYSGRGAQRLAPGAAGTG